MNEWKRLLLRFIRILALHDPVQARTDDGDGGTDQRLRGNLVSECENAETDDEDALTNVTDGVSHRSNLAERLVGDLVVHVVVETNRGERHEEFRFTLDGDGVADESDGSDDIVDDDDQEDVDEEGYDSLEDFIVCKPGKDYGAILKNYKKRCRFSLPPIQLP